MMVSSAAVTGGGDSGPIANPSTGVTSSTSLTNAIQLNASTTIEPLVRAPAQDAAKYAAQEVAQSRVAARVLNQLASLARNAPTAIAAAVEPLTNAVEATERAIRDNR